MLIFGNNLTIEGFDPALTREQESIPKYMNLKKGSIFVNNGKDEAYVGLNVIFDKSLRKLELTNGNVTDTIYVSPDVVIMTDPGTSIVLTGETVQLARSVGIKMKKGCQTSLSLKTENGVHFQITSKTNNPSK